MPSLSYVDAMNEALERLRGVGYEHGPSFVNHAPMAAEAMAVTGLTDAVPGWVEENLRLRRYHDAPAARWSIDPDDEEDWAAALGDFARVEDLTGMFVTALEQQPWQQVLSRWWPILLPGMNGALTHGLIRTAHAVRTVSTCDEPSPLLLRELAAGLGYWAARYSGPVPRQRISTQQPWSLEQAETALDDMMGEHAGRYVARRPAAAVPLIHTVTAPAAVRLVLPHLPAGHYGPSLTTVRSCVATMQTWFAGIPAGAHLSDPPEDVPDPAQLVAAALELGDEHAIKLAEVAFRQHALNGDERLLLASRTATTLLGR